MILKKISINDSRNYLGAWVRTLKPLAIGLNQDLAEAGTLCVVNKTGDFLNLHILFETCACCDDFLPINSVSTDAVEYLGHPDDEIHPDCKGKGEVRHYT